MRNVSATANANPKETKNLPTLFIHITENVHYIHFVRKHVFKNKQ